MRMKLDFVSVCLNYLTDLFPNIISVFLNLTNINKKVRRHFVAVADFNDLLKTENPIFQSSEDHLIDLGFGGQDDLFSLRIFSINNYTEYETQFFWRSGRPLILNAIRCHLANVYILCPTC